jgi:ADP-ribosylglycohydrolase
MTRHFSGKPADTALCRCMQGAVLGAIIGDALGVGPHWYYEPGQVQAEFSGYVDTYVASKPGED